jgi:hypothetical protein
MFIDVRQPCRRINVIANPHSDILARIHVGLHAVLRSGCSAILRPSLNTDVFRFVRSHVDGNEFLLPLLLSCFARRQNAHHAVVIAIKAVLVFLYLATIILQPHGECFIRTAPFDS